MNQTRYIRPIHTPLPHRKRAIRIWGADTMSGKRFRCWNCGFVCNTDREKTGDGVGYHVQDVTDPETTLLPDYSGSAVTYTGTQYSAWQNKGTGDSRDISLSIDNDKTIFMSELDANGDKKVMSHNFTSIVSAGCPHCGCKTYNG